MAYICDQLVNTLQANSDNNHSDNILEILSKDGMKLINYDTQTMEMCKTAISQNWESFEYVIDKNNDIIVFALQVSPLISIFTRNISNTQYIQMVEKDGGYLSIIPYYLHTSDLCMTALFNPIFTFNKKCLNLNLADFDEYCTFGKTIDPFCENNIGDYKSDYEWFCHMIYLKTSLKLNVGDNIDNIEDRMKFVHFKTRNICEQIVKNASVKSARNKIDV